MTRTEIDVTVRTDGPRHRGHGCWFFRRGGHPILAVFVLAFGLCFLVTAWKIAVPALLIMIVLHEWRRRR